MRSLVLLFGNRICLCVLCSDQQNGRTALIRAAEIGIPSCVRVLLNSGANAEVKDKEVRVNGVARFCVHLLFASYLSENGPVLSAASVCVCSC